MRAGGDSLPRGYQLFFQTPTAGPGKQNMQGQQPENHVFGNLATDEYFAGPAAAIELDSAKGDVAGVINA